MEEADEEGPSGHRAPSGALEAPMPGKIIAVRVGVGDRVARGDEVLVVEAMKMENAVRAPRDGVVKAIRVNVGDTVAAGHVLAELE
jgi:propionyl-CoA carboxylase alpha chain/3-methylcrotonyl-CoA carboxylase alpha subunit